MRVPDAVRPLLGRSEVRRSLETASPRHARLLAARYAARVMEAFKVIAQSQFSSEQAGALVQRCFDDLISETEKHGGFLPRGINQPDLEILEQLCLSGERISQLQSQLAASDFDGAVMVRAKSVASTHGVDVEAIGPVMHLNLMSGIARALIEQQRLFQFRAEDRLSPFLPVDPLFRRGREPWVRLTAEDCLTRTKGPTVAAAIARYLDVGKTKWVRKTYQARVWQLRFFEEHVGPDVPLAAVTSDHVRTFRDAIRTLHRLHGKRVGCSFAARQTESVSHRIADKTAAIIFEPVKAFFRWAKSDEGLISTNPAEDVRLVAAKKDKGKKARRPFSANELVTLFNAPIFTGCRSIHRRYDPGDKIISDAKYWIPILGLYTRARLGELVQLHVRDVHLDGPIPYLSINEDNAPDTCAADRKHVKSEAGVRLVPLHSEVMSLGFAAFVEAKAHQNRKGRVRLFGEFSYGSDGQASTVFSKFFARFLDSVGLTDPALVFHSFRHNAEDAFRDALQPQYVIDRIIGHSNSATSAIYGEGASLATLMTAVQAMRLKVRLPVSSFVGAEEVVA